MIHYVYITTNLINGKQYIGEHSSICLNDNYIGSGRIFKEAKKKYGKQNFKKEILEQFDTKEEAFNAQEKYINEYNTLVPNGYNVSPKGGYKNRGSVSLKTIESTRLKNKGKKRSAESKILMSINNGMKHKNLFTIWLEKYGIEEAKKRQKIKNNKISKSSIGKKMSLEAKQKMSDSKKGSIPWNKKLKN